MTRTAALYLRVSKHEQDFENQRPELERLAEVRGLRIVAVFEEKASAMKQRPEFDRMMVAAHRGEFQVLLVWALDRLGRSMQGVSDTILSLDHKRVELVSAREPWLDFAGPVRQLLIAVFAWVAEQERARIVERTCAGLERARAEGIKLGRPRAHVDMSIAISLRAQGLSIRELAKMLGVSRGSLHRALKRPNIPPVLEGPEVPRTTRPAKWPN